MDSNTLVSRGHALVKELDNAGLPPRLAMWVRNNETRSWKLWIVPPASMTDKHAFYRRVSEIVAKHPTELGGIDASDTEMVLDNHPAVQGVRSFVRSPGLNSVHLSGNVFNGFYLPDGIVLRADF